MEKTIYLFNHIFSPVVLVCTVTYVINMPGMRKKKKTPALEKDVPRWKCSCDYPHGVMDMI